MRYLAPPVVCCVLAVACAGQQANRSADAVFSTPAAERARNLAPDLYRNAEAAWRRAEDAKRRRDDPIAEDHRAEAHLWLAAAVVEAERIELARRRDELRREEERWAKQLARDQDASAIVARDISRYQAKAVALREAKRISALGDARTTDPATLDAVLTRVRLNLALAEALGAPDRELQSLRARTDALATSARSSAASAEALLLDTEALLGQTRAQWQEPLPGASTELVETAVATGFAADRTRAGVIVRSNRFFDASGQVSPAAVKRFHGLVAAFPHGPVACQVAVPALQSRVWSRRVAQLVDRLRRVDEPSRVSASMVETESLSAGAVQCTFAAYRDL